LKLRAIGYALPERAVASDEIARWSGLEEKFIAEKIGIASRRFLAEGETPLGLAKRACEDLARRAPELDLAKVGLLVLVTQNPDYKIPHSSALLQHALGLASGTGCFDINLGCSGYVYALSTVKGLMLSEGIRDALLVTCDPYSRIMGRADRDTIALFGDAATATWLSAEKGADIGRLDWGTDGAGAEHLMVPRGGSAKPLSYLDRESPEPGDPAELRLHMNGRGIFNFMIQRLPGTLKACLEKNGLKDEAVDYYVLHQASRFMLQTLGTRLRIPAEKMPMNLERVGNTVSSSIPLLLAELGEKHALRGRTVLVSGFGVGLSWASNILKFEA
jgi:3-oxoacyl-[acyl-carrier-protein] synthase III